MLTQNHSPTSARGFVLLEVMIAVVILAVGLLGLAKLQASTRQLDMESYQRAQAVILMRDMVDRLSANKQAASCYAITTNLAGGSPYLGDGYNGAPACGTGSPNQSAVAVADLQAWDQSLKGAAELAGGVNAGAMLGARGCIYYDAVNNVYIVAVSWQGLLATGVPAAALACGKGTYGADENRRTISETVYFATLT